MNNTWEREMFWGKTITVFGGTGTIGSFIVEALQPYEPHSIRVFCNDENSLWECEQKWGDGNLRYLLGDIRDFRRVKRAVKDVDYVFNCAAIKHVPFAEYNPMEAVDVNIHGLENIIEACIHYDIKKLLHISTDKAVEPNCCMGMTKGIGERLCQIRDNNKGQSKTLISCIRLGNVWGSRGSIIPLLQKWKEQNLPMKITDKRMERYFIKPKRLQEFIFKVFEIMEGGEIFVPKLKSYKIMDVIKLINYNNLEIEEIGIRKGEKLKEKLLSDSELEEANDLGTMWVIK